MARSPRCDHCLENPCKVYRSIASSKLTRSFDNSVHLVTGTGPLRHGEEIRLEIRFSSDEKKDFRDEARFRPLQLIYKTLEKAISCFALKYVELVQDLQQSSNECGINWTPALLDCMKDACLDVKLRRIMLGCLTPETTCGCMY